MSGTRRRKPASRRGRSTAGGGPEFWGRTPTDDDGVDDITATIDATAMVRSLGPVPLPGREHVAEHYFTTVYERSAALATALAVAADLLASDDD